MKEWNKETYQVVIALLVVVVFIFAALAWSDRDSFSSGGQSQGEVEGWQNPWN